MNGVRDAFRGSAHLLLLLAIGASMFPTPGWAAPPKVVVTIKPIHSLAAAILEGVTTPKLLLDGAASPHSYALKPSDAEALYSADAVIRVSENLEVFLDKALKTLPAKARLIDLDRSPGLTLLPFRGTNDLPHSVAATARTDDEADEHAHGNTDVHFWLDPTNATAIADEMTQQFGAMDPAHFQQYRENNEKLKAKLRALDEAAKTRLAGLSAKPFIVFHDVTQYLEKRYGLNGLGAITLSPERAPGAKRLTLMRAKIKETHAVCVFSEPQFPPKLIETLIGGTDAKNGVLDEVGAAFPLGPDHYFAFMRANIESLRSCLTP